MLHNLEQHSLPFATAISSWTPNRHHCKSRLCITSIVDQKRVRTGGGWKGERVIQHTNLAFAGVPPRTMQPTLMVGEFHDTSLTLLISSKPCTLIASCDMFSFSTLVTFLTNPAPAKNKPLHFQLDRFIFVKIYFTVAFEEVFGAAAIVEGEIVYISIRYGGV